MPNKYLWIAIILFCLTFSFYSVESFVSSIDAININITEDLPVTHIQFILLGLDDKEAYINLSELRILDENNSIVKYWEPQNSLEFEGGNDGYQGKLGPIKNLYDGNPDTFAHSTNAPDALYISLNPPVKLGSIQLTNRKDCCEKRIEKYTMRLYNWGKVIGETRLNELAEKGKTVTYVLKKPITKNVVSKSLPKYPNIIPRPTDTSMMDTIPMDRINLPRCANSPPTDLDKVSKTCDYKIPGGPDGTHRPYGDVELEGFSLF